MSEDSNKRIDRILKFAPLIASVIAFAGGAYVAKFRLELVESGHISLRAEVATLREEVRAELSKKADVDDLAGIKKALGAVQLDVAVICAETVRRSGGDPFRVCRTSRGSDD